MPNSSGEIVSPLPKYACQTRFTIARDVVGDFLSTSHRASVSRLASAPLGSACRNCGTPASTFAPGLRKLPRLRIAVSRGSSRFSAIRLVAPSGHCFHSASIFSFASANAGTVVRQWGMEAVLREGASELYTQLL